MTVEVDFRKLSSSEEDSLKDHAYGIEFINKVVDSVEKRK
jgi:DNA-dependent RNA polymerase auxiliary subunit epsilon